MKANPRDRSRTTRGKTYNLVRSHTKPPRAEEDGLEVSQRWAWLTIEMMEAPAFRTLSPNALKALFRLLIEHNAHGALQNGKLVVTHGQFTDYGVTGEYVADAIDELEYKGHVKVKRGRAGLGTPHANIYTLTYVGDFEGAPPTNEWKRCSEDKCARWSQVERKLAAERRSKLGRKKKTSLRKPEIVPVRVSEMLKAS
jgi:hypothetical protein